VAIIVDLEDKTEYDRAMLKKLAVESELNYEKGSKYNSNDQNYLASPFNSKA
jgi:hypothetical protein